MNWVLAALLLIQPLAHAPGYMAHDGPVLRPLLLSGKPRQSIWLLTSAGSRIGYCGYFWREPADGRYSVSLSKEMITMYF